MKTKLLWMAITYMFSLSVLVAQSTKPNQSVKKAPAQTGQKPTGQSAKTSKILTLTTSGTLEIRLTAAEKKTVTALTLKGDIDERDFMVIRKTMPALRSIDLSAAVIKAYEQSSENQLPISAFFGMEKLTKIILPDNLEAIGYNGFYGCSALKQLILPNSVKKIGGQAFIYCGLTTIRIGDSLAEGIEQIGECENLANIDLSFSNKRYSLFYGVLYNYAKDTLILCPPAKKATFEEIELHENTKVIEKSAFNGCKGLKGKLYLPYELVEIKASAFYNCTGLTDEVEIPNTVIRIGTYAFGGNNNLSKVIIPELKYKDDPEIRGCFIDGDIVNDRCELEIRTKNTKNAKISAKKTEIKIPQKLILP